MAIDFNLPSPQGAIIQGLQTGAVLNQGRQQAIDREKAALANEAFQKDLNSVINKDTPTARDYAALTVKYPQFNEQFEQAWGMLNEEQKSNRISQASEVYSALNAGEPEVAQDMLEQQAVAAENSGDARSAKAARTLAEMVRANPNAAQTSVALRLSSMMGPDKFTETFTKLENDRRSRQLEEADLTEKEAKAYQAAVAADFADSNAALDLQKKGWDITKIQNDIQVSKENQKIAALNSELRKAESRLRGEELSIRKRELEEKLRAAEEARDAKVRGRVAEAESARGNIDNMLNNLDRILQTPSGTLNDALGAWDGSWIGGVLDTFDQDVQDFAALVENLDAQAFLAQVPQMKGLGALSENEGKKLSAALQSFNRKQSVEQFTRNAQEAQRLMLKARENLALKLGVPDTVADTPASEPSPQEIDDLLKLYGDNSAVGMQEGQ